MAKVQVLGKAATASCLLFICVACLLDPASAQTATQRQQQQRQDGGDGRDPEPIPSTSFSCEDRVPGYYADPETGCQVYHMCGAKGRKFSYRCPEHTLFQQRMMVCDHWFMVDCQASLRHYDANLLLGDKNKLFISASENVVRELVQDPSKPQQIISFEPRRLNSDDKKSSSSSSSTKSDKQEDTKQNFPSTLLTSITTPQPPTRKATPFKSSKFVSTVKFTTPSFLSSNNNQFNTQTTPRPAVTNQNINSRPFRTNSPTNGQNFNTQVPFNNQNFNSQSKPSNNQNFNSQSNSPSNNQNFNFQATVNNPNLSNQQNKPPQNFNSQLNSPTNNQNFNSQFNSPSNNQNFNFQTPVNNQNLNNQQNKPIRTFNSQLSTPSNNQNFNSQFNSPSNNQNFNSQFNSPSNKQNFNSQSTFRSNFNNQNIQTTLRPIISLPLSTQRSNNQATPRPRNNASINRPTSQKTTLRPLGLSTDTLSLIRTTLNISEFTETPQRFTTKQYIQTTTTRPFTTVSDDDILYPATINSLLNHDQPALLQIIPDTRRMFFIPNKYEDIPSDFEQQNLEFDNLRNFKAMRFNNNNDKDEDIINGCPSKCFPAFFRPGSCEPCVILR